MKGPVMPSTERVISTDSPLWWVLLSRGLVYTALLMLPVLLMRWLAAQAPPSMTELALILTSAALLPLLYASQYWLLRRFGFRSQNFIWLVLVVFAAPGWRHWKQATTVGGLEHWLGTGLCGFYIAVFAALGLWGCHRNRLEAALLTATRQAQLDLHAHVSAPAQTLDGKPLQATLASTQETR